MSELAAAHSTPDAAAAAWGQQLAVAYRDIGERVMRELPIYHDALEVEPVGFAEFRGRMMGIMITPWFMNVVVPADAATAAGSLIVDLPAGAFEFTLGDVAGIGRIASCSLFSPMFEFEDMAAARVAAEAALNALVTPPSEEPEPTQAGKVSSAIDRRAFLRGTLTESRA
ncbi:[NiFe]-hydrogenase assembly chaperone HybE [Bradyrhizobium ontarionense]|uniref:[NiFe]-hydrogenase assembly chaperone HybE n=1 Tax=Bradyrhizobium ontarionense TaxID=2898149 RepID=A0ABY3RJL0_9BRAD|nr:[NiFe]-hydrogenase assembly chaperone HybE [Bradyrhizobium sp. A19]UFZ07640.1 [NiFe]-hydrogenase assembly chaperone HybE [Bradyrhizobium sp. A19]